MQVFVVYHTEPLTPSGSQALIRQHPQKTVDALLAWAARLLDKPLPAALQPTMRQFGQKKCAKLSVLESAWLQVMLQAIAQPCVLTVAGIDMQTSHLLKQQLWQQLQPLLHACQCQQLIWHTHELDWLTILPGEIGLWQAGQYYPACDETALRSLLRQSSTQYCLCRSEAAAQVLCLKINAYPENTRYFWQPAQTIEKQVLLRCKSADALMRLMQVSWFHTAVLSTQALKLSSTDFPDWRDYFATAASHLPKPDNLPKRKSLRTIWLLAQNEFDWLWHAHPKFIVSIVLIGVLLVSGVWIISPFPALTKQCAIIITLAAFGFAAPGSAARWVVPPQALTGLNNWGIQPWAFGLASWGANSLAHGLIQLPYSLLLMLPTWQALPFSLLALLCLLLLSLGNLAWGLASGLWLRQTRLANIYGSLSWASVVMLLSLALKTWQPNFGLLLGSGVLLTGSGLFCATWQLKKRWFENT
jgi:hypothetical protein